MRAKRAFTLIELLVVVAIIGILATIVVVNVGSARKKSRDAKRISDMKQIMTAEEMYYDKYNTYVDTIDGTKESDWQIAKLNEILESEGLANQDFKDPKNIANNYYYFIWAAGEGPLSDPSKGHIPCDVARGKHLVMGIKNFESISGIHPDNPGISCGWHGAGLFDFAWGVERFEKPL